MGAKKQERRARAFECAEVASEIGPLRMTVGPNGIAAVELRPDPLPLLQRRLERRYGAPVSLEPVRSLAACSELREYLRGKRRSFGARLDLSHLPDFARRVLETLQKVPFGTLISYGELARRAGSPGAARAVGGVMRQNPIPIFIPCHRVTASDGSIGGFTGGLEKKRWLLGLEGVTFLGSARIQ